MPTLVGRELGRYHILEQLGEGGMATVYKAFDTRLERNVAFKVIRTERDETGQFFKRFEREAKALAKLTHPNIVHVNDYGEQEGVPFLVMDFISGGTLKEKLGKPMSWQHATRLILSVARALEYAHKHGIIHRDVKPANILITDSGEPLLSDFGVAKIVTEGLANELTGSGIGIGTPEYMAPEQVLGKPVDGRVDIYALAIVYYEMVAGRTPYQADTPLAIGFKQCYDALPSPNLFNPKLPEGIEHVLVKALAKEPAERYTDMAAFAAALQRLLDYNGKDPTQKTVQPVSRSGERDGDTKPRKAVSPAGPVKKKNKGCFILFLILAVLVLVGLVIVFFLFNYGLLAAPAWLKPFLPGLRASQTTQMDRTPTPFVMIQTPADTQAVLTEPTSTPQPGFETCRLASITNPALAVDFADGQGKFGFNEWDREFQSVSNAGGVMFTNPGVQLVSNMVSTAFIGIYSGTSQNVLSIRLVNTGKYHIALARSGVGTGFTGSAAGGYYLCGLRVDNISNLTYNGEIICNINGIFQPAMRLALPQNETLTIVVDLVTQKFTVFNQRGLVLKTFDIPIPIDARDAFWLIGDPWTDELDSTNLQIQEICFAEVP